METREFLPSYRISNSWPPSSSTFESGNAKTSSDIKSDLQAKAPWKILRLNNLSTLTDVWPRSSSLFNEHFRNIAAKSVFLFFKFNQSIRIDQ
ncbi:hypothetical protein CDAR_613951 [Caerostris darwini]|uniref:Uncharacterized protein n=1 Tax=Caerostris darwini TaxID=1538125 RepID=A0AAV4UGX4_9ARAC|nr:hypothetical protein CDAR_613951 [Caerostris darwini]